MASESFQLAPGARVIIRDEEWMVQSAPPISQGGYAVKAVGLSELVRGHEKVFLTALDEVQELRPEDTRLVSDDTPGFRRSRLYLEALLRRTPPTDARLYLGHHAAIDIKQYQLQPAHLALSNLRPRILMADSVGLGKTIEVGVLLAELIKRGRGERILVVAIKSMLGQLQKELWSRFGIGLVRLDSVGIQRVREKIPANKNPFYYFNRAIISIDTLKNDGQYRHYLEQCHWDVIVVDEAHNVANADTQRSRLSSLLARTCDALLLTSATPHNGRPESFANLINMLDPTAVADPSSYTHEEIRGLYSRRFKKDIEDETAGAFSQRQTRRVHVPASPAEEDVFEVLAGLSFSTFAAKRRSGRDALFQTTLLKSFLSSPAACLETIDHRIHEIEKAIEAGRGERVRLQDDRAKLKSLHRDVERANDTEHSKYKALLDELKKIGWNGGPKSPRVIVFSERRATLAWLAEQLRDHFKLKDGVLREFHGSLPDVEQQDVVEDFGKSDNPVRILIASDVASEGVNLHYYCHELIHFDIPWSLITLEQRNGRIDRYGQKEQPWIRYVLAISSQPLIKADLRIVERLVEKAETVERNLGDAAALMGLYDAERESDAIAEAIERDLAPEVVLPDEPERFDFLTMLEQADETPSDKVPLAEILSLYGKDEAFCRAAFDEILSDDKELRAPEWFPENPTFRFIAPEDLQRRCYQLPREAVPRGWEFTVSTEKAQVIDSIERARTKEGEWPDTQLLWELHPVMAWLVDKVLVRYGRHEAPVVVAPKLGSGAAAFVFQGICSNKQSQPMVVDWFGVMFAGEGVPTCVVSLGELLTQSGLGQGLANPGRQSVLMDNLPVLVEPAVKQARNHMGELRLQRGQELGKQLRDDTRRLKKWHQTATALLEAKLESSKGGRGAIPRHLAEKYDQKRKVLDHWMALHETWLKETLHAEPTPYLRMALALVGE